MAERYGTDLTGLAGFEGGINTEQGAPLISTSTDGETAVLFGSAALREILTGVANGDFSIAPDDPTANITESNPLPFWTVTTVGTACSAQMVVDTDASSGRVLQVTVGAGTGNSLTLSRYIPIPGTRARTFCAAPMLTMGGASNFSDAEVYATGQQYDAAGNSVSSTVSLFNYDFPVYTGTKVQLVPDLDALASWPDTAIEPGASFYLLKIVFSNVGTTAAARTIKVYDVRLIIGNTDILIAESTTPATYGPGYIRQSNGALIITADSATAASGLTVTSSGADVDGNFTATGNATITGRLTSADALIGAAAIGTNGTYSGFNINMTGSQGLRHDEPQTTTQTSSAAIWVTVSGTNRQLRRNSSSARYKTNIVDADEVVLEAARKVKPRHYESTIEDENGATRLGFIAEEIHEAGLTHAVGYDAEGKPETIDPVALIAALWHRVNDLESRLRELEK
jgi:hypothetical protein